MSVSCGFFNSSNKDRLYDARQFSSIFDGIINDGVYMGYGGHFAVTAMPTPSLSVNLASGRAWFNHTWTLNDSVMTMTFDSTMTGRCDAIVLQVDTTDAVRANKIYIKKGTEGSPATKPTMVRENGVYEYPICYVTIPDTNVIAQTAIENKVGSSDTPYVTGIIETIDTDDLIAQWQSEWEDWKTSIDQWEEDEQAAYQAWVDEFEAWYEGWKQDNTDDFLEWFQYIKDILDEATAGHLQNEIEELQKTKQNNEALVDYTMLATGWSGNDYSFESEYTSDEYDIVGMYPNNQTTAVMREALSLADIGGYSATNIVSAHGQKPSIDIKVTLVVRYKTPGAIVPPVTPN